MPDRIVNAYLCKSDNVIVAHPSGTFMGYGGYVGIGPYRSISPEAASPDCIGRLIADLLSLSGPTKYHIRDIAKYRDESLDAESLRLFATYFESIQNGADLARRFKQVEFWRYARSNKLKAYSSIYNKRRDVSVGSIETIVDVSDIREIGETFLALSAAAS